MGLRYRGSAIGVTVTIPTPPGVRPNVVRASPNCAMTQAFV